MAQIVIDTSEIQNIAHTIDSHLKNSLDELNSLFKRIEDVPIVSKEWVGSSSQKFSDLSKEDKIKYYKFISDLGTYSNFINDFSISIDNAITNIKENL